MFEAMVTRVKAKLRALQGAKEEESGTESKTEDEDDEDNFEPETLIANSSTLHTTPHLS